MGLESTLKSVISRLRSNDLENEEEVKLAVILPILLALDWDPAYSGSIKPEYSAGQGRVDYALLCHGRPQVFIEAKRRGALNVQAEEQLFGYASNQGIPLLILTDGFHWDFYLSMAEGLPEERRFYRLELFHEENIPEYMGVLETYLRERCVASRQARHSAEACLERNRDRARAKQAIPSAWNSLLSEPDELLCDLLAEKVQHIIGAKPDPYDVDEYLRNLLPNPAKPVRREPSNRLGPPTFVDATDTLEFGPGVEDRLVMTRDTPSQLSHKEALRGENLQDIIYDLMRSLLERSPRIVDDNLIAYLETTKNPLGLKLNYPLIRRASEGRFINGHSRYKAAVYAGQWLVCTEWNKSNHPHNAKRLTEWVNSLISCTSSQNTQEFLANIEKRLHAYVTGTLG